MANQPQTLKKTVTRDDYPILCASMERCLRIEGLPGYIRCAISQDGQKFILQVLINSVNNTLLVSFCLKTFNSEMEFAEFIDGAINNGIKELKDLMETMYPAFFALRLPVQVGQQETKK